jgi:hypothetical protein
MSQHGTMLLCVEIALLIATSVAAMATDGYWTRRNKSQSDLLAASRTGARQAASAAGDSTASPDVEDTSPDATHAKNA